MIHREIRPLKNKSFFLLGPRGVGKSTWLQNHFNSSEALFVDLLDPRVYEEYLLNPERFEQLILQPKNKNKVIVIDEIQRLPKLLNYAHIYIQKLKLRFVLTGSSARKLKQQGVNLLAGRASLYRLFPFSSVELKDSFDLNKALERGTLPDAYLAQSEEELEEYLNAYVYTYIEKEIQQEQWVRKLEPFRKFLQVAAQMNGKIVNRAKIADEIGVENKSVASYYEILEDTLLGIEIPAYHKSVRKSQKQAPKFYFIDTGIKRAIDKTISIPLLPQTSAYGEAFEHFVILELIKLNEYKRLNWRFFYLRTKDDLEIDLVIERPGKPLLLIEIKSKTKVTQSDGKALESLGPDLDKKSERILLSRDPTPQKWKETQALYWQDYILNLRN